MKSDLENLMEAGQTTEIAALRAERDELRVAAQRVIDIYETAQGDALCSAMFKLAAALAKEPA